MCVYINIYIDMCVCIYLAHLLFKVKNKIIVDEQILPLASTNRISVTLSVQKELEGKVRVMRKLRFEISDFIASSFK